MEEDLIKRIIFVYCQHLINFPRIRVSRGGSVTIPVQQGVVV